MKRLDCLTKLEIASFVRSTVSRESHALQSRLCSIRTIESRRSVDQSTVRNEDTTVLPSKCFKQCHDTAQFAYLGLLCIHRRSRIGVSWRMASCNTNTALLTTRQLTTTGHLTSHQDHRSLTAFLDQRLQDVKGCSSLASGFAINKRRVGCHSRCRYRWLTNWSIQCCDSSHCVSSMPAIEI